MKFKYIVLCLVAVTMTACNSVYVKPNSLEPGATIYTRYGGYSMRRSIKRSLEERGFDVQVHAPRTTKEDIVEEEEISHFSVPIPTDAKYIIKVSERNEYLNPLCAFTGFWWWNFNVSISEQQTGHEILAWRGRGCADSSVRRLNRILNTMEAKDEQ